MSHYKGFLEIELSTEQLTKIQKYLKKKLKKNYGVMPYALVAQPYVPQGFLSIKILSVEEFRKLNNFFTENKLRRCD